MNLDTLKQIVKVAKDEGLTELKVDTKDFKIELSFASSSIAPVQQIQPLAQPITLAPVAAPISKNAPAIDTNLHVITSPFVGTFYSSPGPGKAVYAKVGDRVKVGQPLCVLEAMKIMNEIDADVAGEVVEICVENESLVEYGQPLFKIKPI
jgi:acetyl-CoA carboxylase biotin carboxyl carrier protein